MGLLIGIKSGRKKSEAAAIIRNMLELGTFDLDPAKTAELLVDNAWKTMPDIFNGQFGHYPHMLSSAATALASGLNTTRNTDEYQAALLISLGKILNQIKVNRSLYSFHGIDVRLLASARESFAENTRSLSDLINRSENPSGRGKISLILQVNSCSIGQ